MTAPPPWYERGPDGIPTGRTWDTEDQARAEVAPSCTVYQETSALVGDTSFGYTAFTRPAPRPPVTGWRPLGYRSEPT
ncbi:hypothetical protein ACFXGA_05750 [Actinosynnema sp. NPDC059335]|uniref:hypothetical protein n=1 Tax=Actinosynnema sp. NPDC059335 TaxID=3346804 RepID=UPI0036716F15